MICVICRQTETTEGITSVKFERDELRLVINKVPARICPSCGEAYVDEKVATQLLALAAELSRAGIVDISSEYDAA
ncbi:MAG: type II toxin-antitoxin system MqsA family antitoxin [Anaerolineales bacterium]